MIRQWNRRYLGREKESHCDGNRVEQVCNNGISTVTSYYFVGGLYEMTGSTIRKYCSIAEMTIAMKQDSGALQYLLTDHLDSVVAVTGDFRQRLFEWKERWKMRLTLQEWSDSGDLSATLNP